MLVLSVDLHEDLPDALESGERNRDPVDHGPAPTGSQDLPAYGDLTLGLVDAQAEGLEVETAGHVEDGFDRAFVFTRSHQIAVGPLAADEAKGIDDDGFPGAGLTGQEVQTRAEFDLRGSDDREVFDAQDTEHKKAREGSMEPARFRVPFVDPHKILCDPERSTTAYR